MKPTSASSTTQIIVNVKDVALTNKIKNAIKMLQGVGTIRVSYPAKKSGSLEKAIEAAHTEPLYTTNDLDDLMTSLKS